MDRMVKGNPYTVPEGFFDESARTIITRTNSIRRNRKIAGIALGSVAASLLLAAVLWKPVSIVDYSYTAMADVDLDCVVAVNEHDVFLATNY